MSAELSNDDRCAVDLLLENAAPGTAAMTSCLANAPSQELRERLTRVENLLHTLDSFKAAEPADDLVARTLAFCEARPQRHLPREAITPSSTMHAR